MSAHTPGPWEALAMRDDARGFRVREVRHRSANAVGGIHAEVHEIGAVGGLARLDADARLIAAAPDLLAALEGLVKLDACDSDEPVGLKAWKRARAAIARARGGK